MSFLSEMWKLEVSPALYRVRHPVNSLARNFIRYEILRAEHVLDQIQHMPGGHSDIAERWERRLARLQKTDEETSRGLGIPTYYEERRGGRAGPGVPYRWF